MAKQPTAAILLIGNELLSGRTQDKNLAYIATKLVELGIAHVEARVIPDIENVIVHTVNELRAKVDYLFTTGGIGPTHDDITSACVAKAFGVKLIRHPEAVKRLEAHYRDRPQVLNEARLQMADIPEGAKLVDNPVSGAPGFNIGNVYVMAGVPSIMQAMFDNIAVELKGGEKKKSRTVTTNVPEGDLADGLRALQENYAEIDIGSYPFIRSGVLGTSLVIRGFDEVEMAELEQKIITLATSLGGTIYPTE